MRLSALRRWWEPGLEATDPARHVIQVERALALVRWLAILTVALGAPFANLPQRDLAATYAVVLTGAVYTLAIQWIIAHRAEWLSGGYLTSAGEVGLISLVISASGGPYSPLFPAYFLTVVAAALRFGLAAALVGSVLSIVLYVIVIVLHPSGVAPNPGDLALRFGFLLTTGLLAGYLAREAEQSRRALAHELETTRELHRESEALARENAELSRSLQERLHELERTQAQLLQSAKLAAIGELAANVAHEINNPLAGILASAELAVDEAPNEQLAHDLRVIRDEAVRARGIVRQLLDFARHSEPRMEILDPRELVAATLPLVAKRATLAGVRLVEDYADGRLDVRADAGQLKQVVINLVTNAVDATPKGGEVRVSAERHLDEVWIVVRDTGAGIAAEVRDRLFEPFVTTKPGVSGTGLGLSVSYGIVQRHGGRISVESRPGSGSVFTVHLPACDG